MLFGLKNFAASFGLTPKETEIFECFAEGAVSLKELSSELGMSDNTVNNHFRRIFEKTNTNSRSALLMLFLKSVIETQKSCKDLHKRPRVLVVDDEPMMCEILTDTLTQKGMKVHAYTNPAQALEALPKLKVDLIISDIQMPKMNGIEFLQEVQKSRVHSPSVLFISGFSNNYSEMDCMNLGAAGLMEKPIDFKKLMLRVIEQCVEHPQDYDRLFRADIKVDVTIDNAISLKVQDIGSGGVFISFEDQFANDQDLLEKFKKGKVISFEFQLDDANTRIKTDGEIVWCRPLDDGKSKPGMGVKFLGLSHSARDLIDDFIRTKNILSYIPIGTKPLIA